MTTPTGYTFPLAGGTLGGTAQSSTGATRPYAYCRQMVPNTGDVVMNGATWAASSTPMLEVVLRVLRTPLGRYLPNARFGVDYGLLQSLLPTTGSTWRAEVLRALKTYVDQGQLQDVRVKIDVTSSGLAYEVSFIDPRSKQRATTGKLTA